MRAIETNPNCIFSFEGIDQEASKILKPMITCSGPRTCHMTVISSNWNHKLYFEECKIAAFIVQTERE